jgi:hypothetical protein
MTTYILIVYLWAGGKMTYPYRFQSMAMCQAEAETQMEHGEAVSGTVCIEARTLVQVRTR